MRVNIKAQGFTSLESVFAMICCASQVVSMTIKSWQQGQADYFSRLEHSLHGRVQDFEKLCALKNVAYAYGTDSVGSRGKMSNILLLIVGLVPPYMLRSCNEKAQRTEPLGLECTNTDLQPLPPNLRKTTCPF